MNEEKEAKIAKLPVWAREEMDRLRRAAAPNQEEIARLHREVERRERIVRQQGDRIEAMLAMFQCAARGGSEIALAVQKIVQGFLTHDEE